jgi:hypothetical protein
VWEGCEGKIEVVGQLPILEFGWFRKCIPNSVQVGGQCSLEVCEGGRSDVVADDEKKKCALI